MEHRIFNTEKYLQKNKPEEPSEKIMESAKKLMEPTMEIDYENQNSAQLEKGVDTLELSFSTLNEETQGVLQSLVGTSDKDDFISKRTDVTKWRELTKFTILRESNNTPILDLIKLVPPDYKVLFFPQKEFVNACAVRSDNHKLILYIGDLSAEIVTPVLLHEIGHVIDFGRLNSTSDNKLVTDSEFQGEAEKLREERAASAFALKILRPRFKENSLMEKERLTGFLKSIALNTYHESIDSLLREKDFWGMHKRYWENLGQKLQHEHDAEMAYVEEQEEYDRQLAEFEKIKETQEWKLWREKRNDDWEWDQMYKWEEWLEFLESKNTDEFKNWKKLPENSKIDDEEQERQKFENDKIDKYWREQGMSRPKTIKDVLQ